MAAKHIDFPIPKGYNPPFAVITDHDHSAYLIIACALGIALVSLFIVIHVFLRSAFGHGFGSDDTVLFLATVSWLNDSRPLHHLKPLTPPLAGRSLRSKQRHMDSRGARPRSLRQLIDADPARDCAGGEQPIVHGRQSADLDSSSTPLISLPLSHSLSPNAPWDCSFYALLLSAPTRHLSGSS